MSADYSPRGSGGSSGGGSGRRRRGGRGRTGGGVGGNGNYRPAENRVRGAGGVGSTPAKKEGFISKLLGWFTGKKDKTESKPFRGASAPRTEFKERDLREPREDKPKREDRPPRPEPVAQEIVSPKLYVGNLSYEAVESDLFDLFSKIGAVKNVEIAMDRHANRSKGFGFVEMETLETAKEAAAKLNRTDFMARQIVVSGAKLDKRTVTSREPEAGGGESGPESII